MTLSLSTLPSSPVIEPGTPHLSLPPSGALLPLVLSLPSTSLPSILD